MPKKCKSVTKRKAIQEAALRKRGKTRRRIEAIKDDALLAKELEFL